MSGPEPTEVVVAVLDVHDDEALERWYAVRAASQRHGREATASNWSLPELTVQLRTPDPRRTRVALVGRDRAGEVVAGAMVVASLVDNLTAAEVGVDVRPDRRRRGIGTVLLAAAEQVARDHGRTVLQSEVAWPHDADPRGAGTPEVEFARARGYDLGIVDVQRELDLPVAPGLLEQLGAAAAPHHTAYDVRAWCGPVPDELADSWAALAATLMTEAPTGEMEREVEAYDAAALREQEAIAAAQGRTKWNAVALDAAGVVVAYTDIATMQHEPGLAYQWGTLVHRDHRGHRLGTAVKVANLVQLTRERPDITRVRTWNAEVNGHMIGVNEALGFVATERLGELQKRIG